MKVKIFKNDPVPTEVGSPLENEINEWLHNNPEVEILNINLSTEFIAPRSSIPNALIANPGYYVGFAVVTYKGKTNS